MEWKAERAILMQKLQIQEMYIAESKEREENLRKMNETFMSSLMAPQEPITKQYQKSYENEQILKQQDIIRALQIDIKCLQDRLTDKENQIATNAQNNEKELQQLHSKVLELEAYKFEQRQKLEILDKCKLQYESQLRKLKTANQQPKDDQEELIKLKDENTKLRCQVKAQETSLKTLRSKIEPQEQELGNIQKQHMELQVKYQTLLNQNEYLKNQVIQLQAQMDEIKAQNQRQRHQSPNYPTTRIRTFNQTNESQAEPMDLIKDIQNKLYHTKKKITTTTAEESTFIRQSIQKIKNVFIIIKQRSRGHSISVNENTFILDDSKINQWDDSIEFRSAVQNRYA